MDFLTPAIPSAAAAAHCQAFPENITVFAGLKRADASSPEHRRKALLVIHVHVGLPSHSTGKEIIELKKNDFGKRRCAPPRKRNPARKTSPTSETTENQSAIKKQAAATEVRPSAQTKEAQLTHWPRVRADTCPSYLYDAACGRSLAHGLLSAALVS